MKRLVTLVLVAGAALAVVAQPAAAEITRFKDRHPEGNAIEYWRLSHNPAIRVYPNYHNTQCWSPDGRYVCYHNLDYRPYEVHAVDLHTGEDIVVGRGGRPRWAKQHNWLLFSRPNAEGGNRWEKGTEVCRYDCETGETVVITWGMEELGSTDKDDRWIFGTQFRRDLPQDLTGADKVCYIGRARIEPGSPLEIIHKDYHLRAICNPGHDVISTRWPDNLKAGPFETRDKWMDLDGSNVRIGAPQVQSIHAAWSGDGQWKLVGNYQVQGRKWNEPFPSDMHLLANVAVGDIGPCGRSGRWICGDYTVADLRSGDSLHLPRPASVLCYPSSIPDSSGHYDANPKGSPDGTKIGFCSNFDHQSAPFTQITETVSYDEGRMPVTSTEGFPESGELNVRREVIGYSSKTPTSFEGLEPQKYDTRKTSVLREGWEVALFGARLMTEQERERALPPPSFLVEAVEQAGGDGTSPLLYQRQTDMYVSVVRLPDPPHLRLAGDVVQLIPGENHWETFGYYLERDGARLNEELLRQATEMDLTEPGTYRAIVVEWSGLEGKESLPLQLDKPARLRVLAEKPGDFSWTNRLWLVAGRQVPEAQALAAAKATRETRHLHDGVIAREHYERGIIVAAEDLNLDGYPTRRLTYADEKLATREYWTPNDERISLEKFGPDGFKTEELHWRHIGAAQETDHWFYDHGWPIKRIKLISGGGERVYEKRGDDWVIVGE